MGSETRGLFAPAEAAGIVTTAQPAAPSGPWVGSLPALRDNIPLASSVGAVSYTELDKRSYERKLSILGATAPSGWNAVGLSPSIQVVGELDRFFVARQVEARQPPGILIAKDGEGTFALPADFIPFAAHKSGVIVGTDNLETPNRGRVLTVCQELIPPAFALYDLTTMVYRRGENLELNKLIDSGLVFTVAEIIQEDGVIYTRGVLNGVERYFRIDAPLSWWEPKPCGGAGGGGGSTAQNSRGVSLWGSNTEYLGIPPERAPWSIPWTDFDGPRGGGGTTPPPPPIPTPGSLVLLTLGAILLGRLRPEHP